MARVLLKNVTKRYGDVVAVQEFNLEIADKEFLVLVGPSGCGKSTTLRMIAGLEEISGGDLHIGDRRVNDVAPKDRDVAMVFQNYALYPHMSVFENMSFALKLRKVPKAEINKKVHKVADILDIESLLDRKPKQLSGGQRQRVAMGRAIIREPSVFLFDEPLSNLDAKLRVQMRVELSRLHNRLQTTIVYVTHDQVEAMTLADRIVVMKDGWIQQVGAPMEVYHKPANAFVAGFIGSPSMNFLSGRIDRADDGALRIVGDGFDMPVPGAYKDVDLSNVQIGIRPQGISPTFEGDARISAQVTVIEPMGNETFFYFDVGGLQIVARSDSGSDARVGDELSFGIDMDAVHLFDAATGARLIA
jgi:multiple sugar transport system ATP-binding protein